MHPVKKKRILHAGVDLAAPYGTPVYASGSGKVVEARYSSSYGWYIEIRHAGGFSTLYAHLSKLHVRKGSDVCIGRHIPVLKRVINLIRYTMNIEEAKSIQLEDYLRRMGFNPVKQQGDSIWYCSPFREEKTPSFKVSASRNL